MSWRYSTKDVIWNKILVAQKISSEIRYWKQKFKNVIKKQKQKQFVKQNDHLKISRNASIFNNRIVHLYDQTINFEKITWVNKTTKYEFCT